MGRMFMKTYIPERAEWPVLEYDEMRQYSYSVGRRRIGRIIEKKTRLYLPCSPQA